MSLTYHISKTKKDGYDVEAMMYIRYGIRMLNHLYNYRSGKLGSFRRDLARATITHACSLRMSGDLFLIYFHLRAF